MSSPREIWTFDVRHVGRRVLVFDHLPSTNDHAVELATDPANAGTVTLTGSTCSSRTGRRAGSTTLAPARTWTALFIGTGARSRTTPRW